MSVFLENYAGEPFTGTFHNLPTQNLLYITLVVDNICVCTKFGRVKAQKQQLWGAAQSLQPLDVLFSTGQAKTAGQTCAEVVERGNAWVQRGLWKRNLNRAYLFIFLLYLFIRHLHIAHCVPHASHKIGPTFSL